MKKMLVIFLVLMLVFTLPMNAIAQESAEENGTTENTLTVSTDQPQIPIITEDMTEKDANDLIDKYNKQVDEYNASAKEENEKNNAEYDKQVQEVTEHNKQEEEKVSENKEAIAKQEKVEARIAADSVSKLENQTTNYNDLPTSWEGESTNLATIEKVENESSEFYKVLNLHIYLNENASDTYTSSTITGDTFKINISPEDLVLAEWEVIKAGNNDIVTVDCQSKFYPNSGAIFRRFLEGYTNGHWIPTQEFNSTAKDITDNWNDKGSSTTFSYADGTTDHLPAKDVLNIFTYNFVRYGPEPTPVEVYIPSFKTYPEKPVDIEYLNKLDHIQRPQPEKEEEEEPKKEEEQKPKKEEEQKPKKEKEESSKKDEKKTPVEKKDEPKLVKEWIKENKGNRAVATLPATGDGVDMYIVSLLGILGAVLIGSVVYLTKRG